jgi:hypothetical protein
MRRSLVAKGRSVVGSAISAPARREAKEIVQKEVVVYKKFNPFQRNPMSSGWHRMGDEAALALASRPWLLTAANQ